MKSVSGILLLLAFGLVACEPAEQVARPNIVLVLTDDMGVETLGAYGGLDYATPNLDRLAKQGIVFSNAHSQPSCTPSRIKLLTGQYLFRNYEAFGYLRPSATTFVQSLRKAGYTSLVAGKWHLAKKAVPGMPNIHRGAGAGITPKQAGFTDSLIRISDPSNPMYYGTRFHRHENNGDTSTKTTSRRVYAPKLVLQKVENFIKAQSKTPAPFFVYYATNLVHTPWQSPPRRTDSNKHKAMVEELDFLMGRLFATLKKAGVADNTIVLFTSANGTARMVVSRQRVAGQVQEVAGGKSTTLRTATNVPFIAWSPLFAKAKHTKGRKQEALIGFADFFPTIMELAGAKPPRNHTLDGKSFAPLLFGKPYEARSALALQYALVPNLAFRYVFDTQWKLYGNGDFFDLRQDPLEKTPLDVAGLSAEAQAAYERFGAQLKQMRRDSHGTLLGRKGDIIENAAYTHSRERLNWIQTRR